MEQWRRKEGGRDARSTSHGQRTIVRSCVRPAAQCLLCSAGIPAGDRHAVRWSSRCVVRRSQQREDRGPEAVRQRRTQRSSQPDIPRHRTVGRRTRASCRPEPEVTGPARRRRGSCGCDAISRQHRDPQESSVRSVGANTHECRTLAGRKDRIRQHDHAGGQGRAGPVQTAAPAVLPHWQKAEAGGTGCEMRSSRGNFTPVACRPASAVFGNSESRRTAGLRKKNLVGAAWLAIPGGHSLNTGEVRRTTAVFSRIAP